MIFIVCPHRRDALQAAHELDFPKNETIILSQHGLTARGFQIKPEDEVLVIRPDEFDSEVRGRILWEMLPACAGAPDHAKYLKSRLGDKVPVPA
jgi:hypothetical protein